MKIVFEGSEQQIGNLLGQFEMLKGDFPKVRPNYQTENLWCAQDVQSQYNCTDTQALEVLEDALTNEGTMEQIWYAIRFCAEEAELEEVEN